MLTFRSILHIEESGYITDRYTDESTVLNTLRVNSVNDLLMLILAASDTEFVYLNLGKILRNYAYANITIGDFISSKITDEILANYSIDRYYPLTNKRVSMFGIADVMSSLTAYFLDITSGKSSTSITNSSTSDFYLSIANKSHTNIIPIFDNRLYYNYSTSSSSIIIKGIKNTINLNYNASFPIERLNFFDLTSITSSLHQALITNLSPIVDTASGKITIDYSGVTGITYSTLDAFVVIDGYLVPKRHVTVDTTNKKIYLTSRILKHSTSFSDIESMTTLAGSNSFVILLPCKYWIKYYNPVFDNIYHSYIYTTEQITDSTVLGLNTDTNEIVNVITLKSQLQDPNGNYLFSETYSGTALADEVSTKYTKPITKYDISFQQNDIDITSNAYIPLYESSEVYNSRATVNKGIPIKLFKIMFSA
jgi:hypothetical protein